MEISFLRIVCLLALLFQIGCRASIVSPQWFDGGKVVEPIIGNEDKPFIKMKTGEKKYVDSISYNVNQTGRKLAIVTADNKDYTNEQVEAFMKDKYNYFIKYKNVFVKQISTGKISIYEIKKFETKTDSKGNTFGSFYEPYYLYSKNGGDIMTLDNVKEMSKAVEDCEKARQMLDGGYSKVYKNVKNDSRYLFKVFKVYNEDCK